MGHLLKPHGPGVCPLSGSLGFARAPGPPTPSLPSIGSAGAGGEIKWTLVLNNKETCLFCFPCRRLCPPWSLLLHSSKPLQQSWVQSSQGGSCMGTPLPSTQMEHSASKCYSLKYFSSPTLQRAHWAHECPYSRCGPTISFSKWRNIAWYTLCMICHNCNV